VHYSKVCTFTFFPAVLAFFLISFPHPGSTQSFVAEDKQKIIDPSLFTFTLSPGIELPIEMGEKDLITLGYATDLTGSLPFPGFPAIAPAVNFSYSFIPVRADTSMSVMAADGGVLLTLRPAPRLVVFSFLGAGIYLSLFNQKMYTEDDIPFDNQTGGSFHLNGGIGISFYLAPFFSIGAAGSYRLYNGLYHGIRGAVATSLHVSGFQRKVNFNDINLQEVYPILYKYYDQNSFGDALIINNERFAAKDIEVTAYSGRFMDKPTVCSAPSALRPGEAGQIQINALFSDEVLKLEEGTKIALELTASYTLNGVRRTTQAVGSLRLNNRNALTWDDDRKAAAFISTKNRELLRFSKKVAGMVRKKMTSALNINMQIGIAMYQALSTYGLNYVVDPNTPSYVEASADISVIDFIQFPVQTLDYRAGDCDDLSILFCSLLESVGIKTAFITIPGHIFMAFALDISPEEALQSVSSSDKLIFYNDNTWIPVEMTKLDAGFNDAWSLGADQWSLHEKNNTAGFFPVHESWKVYEASGYPGGGEELLLPEERDLQEAYITELERFVNKELYPQVEQIRNKISTSSDPAKYKNLLAVLYARYGLYERAEDLFHSLVRSPVVHRQSGRD
jgi:hypothetical protein